MSFYNWVVDAFIVNPKILVVDDDSGVRESLQHMLSRDFFVISADCGKKAKEIWQFEPVDIAIFDILLPDCSGISLLKEFKKDFPEVPALMITGTRQIRTAVEAMKLGAFDYINKPFTADELTNAIKEAIRLTPEKSGYRKLFKNTKESIFFGNIVGRSQRMIEVYKRIAQVMNTSTTVLIHGESGTGKELVARAIHYNGIRREKPFIPIHIASLSENLLESELFGHEKGAFTGAINAKKGMLELADGGTLFLDEIGDIPLSVQVKLLRVIQEREFRRVGGVKDIKINIRFITATNKDLIRLVGNGTFREDLYYRISVVPIHIPSLRERTEDIPELIYYFFEKFKKSIDTKVVGFTEETMDLFKRYNWQGNVRELENLVEQLILTVDHQWIEPKDVPLVIHENAEFNLLQANMLDYERNMIEDALKKCGGVVIKAANILGVSRRVLKYKIDKYGISLPK